MTSAVNVAMVSSTTKPRVYNKEGGRVLYGTVLQHFTGFMIFFVTKWFQFVPVHHTPAVVTVVVL